MASMADGFTGRVAVITGAAQGTGSRVAERLAELGAAVALWDFNGDGARAQVEKLRANGHRAASAACDVSDSDSVAAALQTTVDGLGTPTLVVTAAGIARARPFLEVEAAEFERQLSVNLTGTFLTMQACANAMVMAKLPGSMVGISSVAGRGPRADLTAYAASKAGVISVVRSAAVALAEYAITVNAVCPGVVATDMTRETQQQRAAELGITEAEAMERLAARIPLGRIQTTDDVSDVIMFLLSQQASYVTGQALNACGGLEFN
jgi:NAD(P)-dependent dehydrogenase (short-subunit alcohol dehydrogenase family)